MNKRIKIQTSQLDINIAKSGCRMTGLFIGTVYCLQYCEFNVDAEKCNIKILHNPQVPVYLKPGTPSMCKNITSYCTTDMGSTVRALLDNASAYGIIPHIYSSIDVIGHIGMFIYFKFQQNRAAINIQKIVDDYIVDRLLENVSDTSNTTTPSISPTTSLETNAAPNVDHEYFKTDNTMIFDHYSFVAASQQETLQNDPFKSKKFN